MKKATNLTKPTKKEAWGVMSDFQMFAVAADENQIKGFYQSGGKNWALEYHPFLLFFFMEPL